jgi:TolB-like protein/Flp pilus assembly protein TadD
VSGGNKAVFLSYASQDAEAARRICETLREAGLEVWFDADGGLEHGDEWDAKIRKQIKECVLFMPIISAHTQARHEGYFRIEWELAAQRAMGIASGVPFILPVVIDDTREPNALVPDRFRTVQWTRLPGGVVTPEVKARYLKLWSQRTGVLAAQEALPTISADTGQRPTLPAKNLRLFPAMAAALLALGALLFWRPWHDNPKLQTEPARPAPSVAVLPFVNQSADKDNEYFSDGIADELLITLAKIPGLKVAARTSAWSFKGRNSTAREVGEQLGMAHVVEGAVQKSGNRVKITVRLSRAATNEEVWSKSFGPLELTDVFATQSELAQALVGELRGRLTGESAASAQAEIAAQVQTATKGGTRNPEAHRLYLQGKFHFHKSTLAGWAESERAFTAALQLDPAFAQAYCGLADLYGYMGGYTMMGRTAWAKEKELAEKALALVPDLADGRLSLGMALAGVFDWKRSETEIKRALEINPNLALAHDQLAWVMTLHGRMDEALQHSQQALELDPLSPVLSNDRAWNLLQMRRYDESIAQARVTIALQPNDAFAHELIGWSLVFKGDFAAAISEFRRARALDDVPRFAGSLGYALAVSGDRAGAEQILKELDEIARRRWVASGVRVYVYLGLGDTPQALDWLEKAFEEQDQLCWNLKVDRTFDPIRHEPRFRALLKKAGFD